MLTGGTPGQNHSGGAILFFISTDVYRRLDPIKVSDTEEYQGIQSHHFYSIPLGELSPPAAEGMVQKMVLLTPYLYFNPDRIYKSPLPGRLGYLYDV